MAPVIRTQGLSKTYRVGFWMRPVVGLKPLDLEVEAGEIFGFIGPNGAGKTTTIKLLMGLHAPTSGSAWIGGKSVDDPDSRERVGFLPERPYFYEHLTATEILDFYGHLTGVPKDLRRERIKSLLARVNLTRFADIQLKKYSKGMLQRVGMCQALINDPEVLVLDEPMSGLDPIGRAMVRDVILEESEKGRTVFFSSHILHDVEVLSDRVAIVIGGQLQGVGTVDSLIGTKERLSDIGYEAAGPIDVGGTERRAPSGLCVRVKEEQVDQAVVTLHAAGAKLVHITPVRGSLEDILLSEIERNAPVDKKNMAEFA